MTWHRRTFLVVAFLQLKTAHLLFEAGCSKFAIASMLFRGFFFFFYCSDIWGLLARLQSCCTMCKLTMKEETVCIPLSFQAQNTARTRKLLLSLIHKWGADWLSWAELSHPESRRETVAEWELSREFLQVPCLTHSHGLTPIICEKQPNGLVSLVWWEITTLWRLFPAFRSQALFSRVNNTAAKIRKGKKSAPGPHLVILTAVNIMYPLMLSHFSI